MFRKVHKSLSYWTVPADLTFSAVQPKQAVGPVQTRVGGNTLLQYKLLYRYVYGYFKNVEKQQTPNTRVPRQTDIIIIIIFYFGSRDLFLHDTYTMCAQKLNTNQSLFFRVYSSCRETRRPFPVARGQFIACPITTDIYFAGP